MFCEYLSSFIEWFFVIGSAVFKKTSMKVQILPHVHTLTVPIFVLKILRKVKYSILLQMLLYLVYIDTYYLRVIAQGIS